MPGSPDGTGESPSYALSFCVVRRPSEAAADAICGAGRYDGGVVRVKAADGARPRKITVCRELATLLKSCVLWQAGSQPGSTS
jgi:hypothetical protein